MEEDLRLRNLRPSTQDGYLRCVRGFARYHMRPPEEMDSEEVREFLLYLRDERRLSPSTVKVHIAALRFLYDTTLQRPEVMAPFRMPKTPRKLPMVLSGSEVEEFFGAIRSIKYRAILMTTYGAALRISEVCKLRSDDIDSKRMLIRVGDGKGGDERYSMLSERLLVMLRAYWRETRPAKPYLFPGRPRTRAISPNAVRQVIDRVVERCSFSKRVTPHTLRHSCATHMLEKGDDIRTIQVLLGHRSIRTTQMYAQVSSRHIARTKSPLDVLGTEEGGVLG